MDKKTVFILSALLSAISSQAYSDGYSYLNAGMADFDGEETDQSLALGIGFDVMEHFAAELSFTNFGHVKDMKFNKTEIDLKAETFSLAAVGFWEFSEEVAAFGKLGLDIWEARTKIPTSNGVNTNTEESVSPYLSFGARYMFTETLAGTAEYQLHQFEIGDTDVSMNNFMMGIQLVY